MSFETNFPICHSIFGNHIISYLFMGKVNDAVINVLYGGKMYAPYARRMAAFAPLPWVVLPIVVWQPRFVVNFMV